MGLCSAWVHGAMQGEICDIDGTCVDAADDEIFKLTTKEGSLSMEREKVSQTTQLHKLCCSILVLRPGQGFSHDRHCRL